MTSSLHCEFDEVNTNFLISSSVAGLKVCKVGGGEIGLVKGSGSVVGENLILMRSILSLKKSRNAFAREVVSGLFGSASGGFRWSIEFNVFHRDRGLDEFSRTKFERKEALAREISFLTTLH